VDSECNNSVSESDFSMAANFSQARDEDSNYVQKLRVSSSLKKMMVRMLSLSCMYAERTNDYRNGRAAKILPTLVDKQLKCITISIHFTSTVFV
jgi:hypothetical protein